LHAQEVAGALEGRVVAGSGEPIEGAEIIVEGLLLQGTRTTATDTRGRFTLRSLPAGSYVVVIRRISYGPVRLQDVPVRLGLTTSLGEVRLEAQAYQVAEIVVSGSRPVIDPVSAATGATLDSSQFRSLPAERDYQALITFLPQANASDYGDGPNIGGSTGLENAFYLDGMHATVGTGFSIDLPFNFVREIQVRTGGYEAEFGRSLSGIVNVVTPSGGNEFRGEVLGFFTGDQFRTDPRVGLEQAEAVSFRRYDLGLSLSGPIQRDRLWYFVAYNPTFASQDAEVAGLPEERDSEVHHLLAGKLTWRADARTDVAFTLLGDPFTHDLVGGGLDILPQTDDPRAVLGRQTGGGTTASVQARRDLGAGTEASFAISRLDRHEDIGPRSGSVSIGALTRVDDFTTNTSSGGFGLYNQTSESRTAVRAALTLVRGRHAMKFGAEYEVNKVNNDVGLSQIIRSSDSVYDWGEQFVILRGRNRIPTLYAQDAWEVSPRIRVSAGLRWEAQYLSGDSGPSRTIGSEFAPRLGVVYQPGEPGSQRLFASAGRFFQQVPPIALTFWNSSGSLRNRQFPQNPLIDSANGVVLADFTFDEVPATPDVVGQHYDQVTLGYERRMGTEFKIGIHGTYRKLRWAIEDGVAPGDSVYRMGNPGRGPLATMPRARQRYTALELSVERSTPGPLYLLASYVLSRNVGNYTGLFATDYFTPGPNAGPQYDVPDLVTDEAYGLLPNDRTHVAKVAASYGLPFGVTLGGFLTVASGTPRSEFGTSSAGFYTTFVRPRGSIGRTPSVWSLDLHAEYSPTFTLAARLRPRFLLDVFNVGSPREVLFYEQLRYLDAARSQENPNYGVVTRYQAPMSARLGMVVEF
jgi:hypothetical protein